MFNNLSLIKTAVEHPSHNTLASLFVPTPTAFYPRVIKQVPLELENDNPLTIVKAFL